MIDAHTAHMDSPRAGLTIRTVRFGAPEQVTVDVSSLYTFAEAMPGLPESHRFALICDPAYAPLRWLQSLDEEVVCLPVLALDALAGDERTARIAAELGLTDDAEERRQVLLVTHFDAAAGSFAVNMLAPVVLDAATATGHQAILEGQAYPLRQHITWDPHTRTFSAPC